ncbi:MAG: hypothetical protein N2234_10070, partial [Planctomycetota bacterium]|nr:hypothetical protein [Planctomycetota bacterium]
MVKEESLSFGHLALKYGYISLEQLQESLAVQKERAARGQIQKLGEILVELGHLTHSQVIELFRKQASM